MGHGSAGLGVVYVSYRSRRLVVSSLRSLYANARRLGLEVDAVALPFPARDLVPRERLPVAFVGLHATMSGPARRRSPAARRQAARLARRVAGAIWDDARARELRLASVYTWPEEWGPPPEGSGWAAGQRIDGRAGERLTAIAAGAEA